MRSLAPSFGLGRSLTVPSWLYLTAAIEELRVRESRMFRGSQESVLLGIKWKCPKLRVRRVFPRLKSEVIRGQESARRFTEWSVRGGNKIFFALRTRKGRRVRNSSEARKGVRSRFPGFAGGGKYENVTSANNGLDSDLRSNQRYYRQKGHKAHKTSVNFSGCIS